MIIEEIRRLKQARGEVSFHHEWQQSNVDAHSIVKISLLLAPGMHVRLHEPPDYVNILTR